jgi:membrane protease YdiL (CAAX protease family)
LPPTNKLGTPKSMKNPNTGTTIKDYLKGDLAAITSLFSKVGSAVSKVAVIIRTFLKGIAQKSGPFWKSTWVMFTIILLIAVAQLTLLWRPIVGVYFNAAVLAILVGLALWRERIRQLAIAAAIIPISTMVVLSLPQTTTFAQMVVFYDVILVLGLIYRFMFTLDYPVQNTRLSLKEYAFSLSLMAVAGEALGVLSYGMLRHHYVFGSTPLPMVAATVAVFAFAEETLFRGLIQQRAARVMHPALAAILSTMLFTLVSINTMTVIAPLFSLILGAVLAFTYSKKQNLVVTGTINVLAKLTYIGLMASFVFR